jgi:lysophospholipase L1-like esterase
MIRRILLPILLVSFLARADAPSIAPAVSRDAAGIVTLAPAADSVLLYTLDGSDPIKTSSPYLAPIDLSHGGTLKVRSFSLDRKTRSELAEAKYEPVCGLTAIPSTLVPITQDRSWPSYDWAKRHVECCKAVKEKRPQVLFIGDSITHFFDVSVWKEHYAPLNAVNLGFGWDRTENVLWRLLHGELEGAGPEVAVVMIGTNNVSINSATEIAEGVKAICQVVHTHDAQTRILLLGIFPRGARPNADREKIKAINALLAPLDGKDGITFLDIGDKFLSADGTITREMMGDYLHPTKKGYQVWVEAMGPTLGRLMGKAGKP